MKSSRNALLTGALAAVIAAYAGQSSAAPYEQDLPMLQATEFAPGVVTTDAFEINAVFNKSGDKVIFSRCDDEFSHCVMMESAYADDGWQTPVTLPFSGDYPDGDPYYSRDFSKLYYISKRPIDGLGKATESYNLWYAERHGKDWGEPVYLAAHSSDKHDLYPSLTDDGSLYYLSFKNDQRHLYHSQLVDGEHQAATPLPNHIYGENGNVGDSMVTPDGKMIIFSISGRADSRGRGDLYYSRLINGEWTVAKSLGDKVNTADHEFTPILSPDGKYLFFTRIEEGKGNVYQIDLSAVHLSLEMHEDGQLADMQKAWQAIAQNKTLSGIPLDTPWKADIYDLVANTMQHPAWGMGHFERNYHLTLALAAEEGVSIDKDVLFAASFLHDMATFKPWVKAGVGHSERASEIVPGILQDMGFPNDKIAQVQDLILGHMFAATPVDDPLAQLFHDADSLDFLGVTGITRILSLNSKSGWASNTRRAITTLETFLNNIPSRLISRAAQKRGANDAEIMRGFLNRLKQDTQGYTAT